MQKSKLSMYMRAVQIAVLYLVLDLPVQVTGYLHFGYEVGLKNFLPAAAGLFFGPEAVLGCCLGCLLSKLCLGIPWLSFGAECVMNVFVGFGVWALWYRIGKPSPPNFKTLKGILRYTLLVLALSLLGSLAARLLIGPMAFPRLFIAYGSMSLLVGLVVNILLASILCVEPVCPPGISFEPDVSFTLTPAPESLMEFNEAVEDAAMLHKIGMKRVFELESCLEELSIRVFRVLPGAEICGTIRFSDTISVHLNYPGKKYNPFHLGKDEDELDTLSLKLLMHRALRAAHSSRGYKSGENYIHIVL